MRNVVSVLEDLARDCERRSAMRSMTVTEAEILQARAGRYREAAREQLAFEQDVIARVKAQPDTRLVLAFTWAVMAAAAIAAAALLLF